MARQSRRSPMIGVIMKWSWGLCTDLLAFALHMRKIPENLRRPSDEGAVRPVIASNGVPCPQMRSVGLHSTLWREKEGKKERTGPYHNFFEVKTLYILSLNFFCTKLYLIYCPTFARLHIFCEFYFIFSASVKINSHSRYLKLNIFYIVIIYYYFASCWILLVNNITSDVILDITSPKFIIMLFKVIFPL